MPQSQYKFIFNFRYYFWILILYPTITSAQSLNVQSTVVNPVLNIISWIFFIIADVGGAIIGSMAAWEIPNYLANKGNHRQPILITIISYAIAYNLLCCYDSWWTNMAGKSINNSFSTNILDLAI